MKELEAISFIVHENASGSGGGGGDGQSATLFAVDWMGAWAARSHKEIVLSY